MKRIIFLLSFALVVTTAHAQTVVQAWVQRYHGPGTNSDFASAIAVDNDANVHVTGYSASTSGDYDYTTIKYSNAGEPLWTNRHNGTGNSDDRANAVAVDASGNVFVTGYSMGSGSSFDFATIKYSSAGLPLWTNRYNGPGNGDDRARALAVDVSGNVLVTGYSASNDGYDDYATIKYSNAGEPLWTNRYNGGGADDATAVAVDTNGNVFVTGFSDRFEPTTDYATIAYSSAGVSLWTNRYHRSVSSFDLATAIAVDSSGNVFVTGYSTGSSSSDDYATVKYSNAGVPLWTNRYNGPANNSDVATSLAVDRSGNVLVTGGSAGSGGALDFATLAYSGAGMPLWTNRYNPPENTHDFAYAVAVDNSGNVFVTGYSIGSGSSNDFATVAYSGAGVPLWTNRYNGPGNGDDQARAIAVDGSGNVFVTGSSSNGTNYDWATIKYSPNVSPVPLALQKVNNQLVLSWTNAVFGLQSASAITGTFTNLPGATSPYTNSITGAQQFFRLISN